MHDVLTIGDGDDWYYHLRESIKNGDFTMQFKVQCFHHIDEVPGYWRVFHHTSFETSSPFEAARVADGLNKAAERAGNPLSYEVDPGLCPSCRLPSCECEPDLF